MCEPVTIGLAFAAVAGAASVVDSIQSAKNLEKQSQFKQQQALKTGAAVGESFIQETEGIRARQFQQRVEIGAEVENLVREATLARGATFAGAAAGGVAGQSVLDATNDLRAQEATTGARLAQFQSFREGDIVAQIRAAETRAKFRLLGAAPTPTPSQSGFGAALGIGASAFGGFTGGFGFGQELQAAQGATGTLTPPTTPSTLAPLPAFGT